MKREWIATLAIALMTLGMMLTFSGPASAAPGVVTNGIAFTPNASPPLGSVQVKPFADYCTLGPVGTDSAGRKVAVTVAHCFQNQGPGATVYRWSPDGNRAAIGTIAYKNVDLDYSVIELFSDATLSSNGPGARIDGVGPSNPFGVACKDGQSTGVTCGWITSQTATRIYTTGSSFNGDSGGPQFVSNTKWVGLVRGVTGSGFEYVKASAILGDIAAQPNPVGKGFVVTNN